MAIFEVVPQSLPGIGNYISSKDPVARVSLNYILNNNKVHKEIKYDCPDNYVAFPLLEKDYQFAASVAMFGMKLRDSRYIRNSQWADIENIALNAYNPSEYLQNEFIRLVAIAKKIYPKKKKNKRRLM